LGLRATLLPTSAPPTSPATVPAAASSVAVLELPPPFSSLLPEELLGEVAFC